MQPVDTRPLPVCNGKQRPVGGKEDCGVNVFGGGLALYNKDGKIVGGLGVSGDTSCTDHIIAWKIRHALNLDNVPAGVSPTHDDNIIYDIALDANGHAMSAGGFGHPMCDTKTRRPSPPTCRRHIPSGPTRRL